MTRVKTGTTRREQHNKVRKFAKGFKFSAHRRFRTANEAVLHAGQYAFEGRKLKKRNLRRLWITRLNAAVKEHGLNYSSFIKALNDKHVELDRKILSEIAISDPETFAQILKHLK
ncbi:50S ribosomal protein L20 [Candidatus Woesebacteria bacterium]|nr:MAG: 50S ribosomal protein L20 [Candidatus Woesebacteria bacterium]